MTRFNAFTDVELLELWEGVTLDDGIRYGIEIVPGATRTLGLEIQEEAKHRGLRLETS